MRFLDQLRPGVGNSLTLAAVLTCASLLGTGCGSSGGSEDTNARSARLQIVEPAQNQTFQAGGTIDYVLSTNDFTLVPPFDRRSLELHAPLARHAGEVHSNEQEAEQHEQEVPTHSTDSHSPASDSHGSESEMHGAHGSGEGEMHGGHHSTQDAPDNEGHYHIYLDDAAGSDPHVTDWAPRGTYQLPADIEAGTHTLRFELRDNNHQLLTGEGSEAILFFNIE